ncbi:DUF1266 domain-containing protein [Klebsiella pneumoniae]|nr:DUF1266 domain-containing protein [Klebsiella pneumoniae]
MRRDSRRRQWALALADLLSHRNGLPTKGVQLALKLDDDQRRHLTQQVKKRTGLASAPRRRGVTPADRRDPALLAGGHGQLAAHVYHHMAAQGRVRDALAFDCMRTAFLTRCIAGLGWCDENQAWLVLLLNAQRAQDCFASWEDYATAYVRARRVRLALMDTPTAVAGRDVQEVACYLKASFSRWKTLPWNDFKIFDPV